MTFLFAPLRTMRSASDMGKKSKPALRHLEAGFGFLALNKNYGSDKSLADFSE